MTFGLSSISEDVRKTFARTGIQDKLAKRQHIKPDEFELSCSFSEDVSKSLKSHLKDCCEDILLKLSHLQQPHLREYMTKCLLKLNGAPYFYIIVGSRHLIIIGSLLVWKQDESLYKQLMKVAKDSAALVTDEMDKAYQSLMSPMGVGKKIKGYDMQMRYKFHL